MTHPFTGSWAVNAARCSCVSLCAVGVLASAGLENHSTTAPDFDGVSFTPVRINGVVLVDLNFDASGSGNIVGGPGLPSAYVASDAEYLYFRLRLDESPRVGNQLTSYRAWNVALDLDSDSFNSYEYLISATSWTPAGVYVLRNSVKTPPISGDQAEEFVHLRPISEATSTLDAGSSINGDADFFLSLAVPKSTLGVTALTAIRVVMGSTDSGAAWVNTGTLDDIVSGQSTEYFLSDLITCGSSGCVTTPTKSVDLDGDSVGDAFLYNEATGDWSQWISDRNGGFVLYNQGSWNPGWTVSPANFNGDALTDFFLHSATSGQWFKMIGTHFGFTTESGGAWWPGWQRYVMNLDDDGISDFFLYDGTTGVWFKCLSTPVGFNYEQGGWNPGWEIYPLRLDTDDLGDMFLINRATGRWFSVLGNASGGFWYPSTETWFPGWVLRPGDFNGDALTDLILHDPPTGVYFQAQTTPIPPKMQPGFAYTQGGWSLGWVLHPADLDGDGRDDLFLHDPDTGVWFQMRSDGAGAFLNAGGQTWSLGWQLHPTNLDPGPRTDFLLYHPPTGAWFQARNLDASIFNYSSGTWPPGLSVISRMLAR